MVPLEALSSPPDTDKEVKAEVQSGKDVSSVQTDQCVVASPLGSELDDSSQLCSSPSLTDSTQIFTSPTQRPELSATSPQTKPPAHYQLQLQQALFLHQQEQIQPPQTQILNCTSQPKVQVQTTALHSQVKPIVQVQSPEVQSVAQTPSPAPVPPPVPVSQPDPAAATTVPSGEQTHHSESSQWRQG